MPTKLVRSTDMKVIDGSQVNERYCALYYSWNQSGDSYYGSVRDTCVRIDNDYYKIISTSTCVIAKFAISKSEWSERLWTLEEAIERTSTKQHVRVLALVNLFPDIVDKIKIDYNQSIQDLMVHFYGFLAKKISVY
ncbi:hypothetical protein BDA99DRAFT_559472 [Phascolomyces articulosus]|uniref:Uncharacterized protein n=1 Tax=Phascolomyces articulosus TaxID=60185 RepID=A0AAD5PEJ4_9FUNG|nr:hypothetical protein BDA99DRAFT_559472 [Phascolomyces articulosus]